MLRCIDKFVTVMFGRVMPASARQPKVQPGFGRTGDHMWGFRRHGVPPDIATMGNGYPLAGLAVRPKLLATFCRNVGYLNIFGGNAIVAAAGPAALDMIREENYKRTRAGSAQNKKKPHQSGAALSGNWRSAWHRTLYQH